MKRVTIQNLTIEHFKGIEALDIDFAGRDCAIYGDNGTGKSTVADAWRWLLYGKNAAGEADFAIKPLNENGETADPGAVTSVTALVYVDGMPIELRRTYHEKWTSRRGSTEKVFDGNATDFSIDGIPKSKREYDAFVAQMIASENVFMLISDTGAFCERLDMKARRAVLFDVCGVMSDADIAASDAKFAPVANDIIKYGADDVRKKLANQRKTVNEEKNRIPTRIDECEKSVAGLRGTDFNALRSAVATIKAERSEIAARIARLENDTLTATKQNELDAAKNALTALDNDNRAYRRAQEPDESAYRAGLAAIKAADGRIAALLAQKRAIDDAAAKCSARIDALRAKWQATEDETYEHETACPMCRRPFDEESLAAAAAEHEADKARRQEALAAEAETEKATLKGHIDAQMKIAAEIEAAQKERAELTASAAPKPETEIKDMDGYAEKRAELSEKIAAINGELATYARDKASARGRLLQRAAELDAQAAALESRIAGEAAIERAEARKAELREENERLGRELAALDDKIYLCEEFTRRKVAMVEDAVNSRFEMARFRLYETQLNGGLADVCIAMLDGVPYSDLNHGSKVALGMDIARTLSRAYGVSLPLIVDNAESVTRLPDAETQLIKLTVSASDKELRCDFSEKEAGRYEPAA